ncbi:hypothetical protein ID853_03255 [Xenorhabdus sp. Vera]|uniref:hypothetical protein n=1 Tax=Xenorhabdus koppenhoeferi TaxID=351659 RepID=UPI0019A5779F|nr:hypothetical protein [Xenorhabdus sp. Vera]MBD2809924.1 hypothetical protein [Xenorhabdus sp. Vera]
MNSTKSVLSADVFERFLMQSSSTINEVSLVIFGLSPFTTAKDIPDDIKPLIKEVRTYMRRNLDSISTYYGNRSFTPSTECFLDLVLAVAFRYANEKTPPVIAENISNAVESFIHRNTWEDHMLAFGGNDLLFTVRQIRKTGRGAHRKEDEQAGTNKLLGLMVKLLASKADKYGTSENPKISEIYQDVLSMVEKEGVTMKGLARATFYNKIQKAVASIHD